MKNLFIMGKAGAGKDTLAEILRDKHGYRLVTFADNIRLEYGRFFDGKNARTDRAKLQQIGQTYKQLYGEDVWTRMLLDEVKYEKEHFDNQFAVTDGRHQIEYDVFVIQEKYLPIWVDCCDEERYERLVKRDGTLQEEALKNECQDLWDSDAYILNNRGTIEQLENGIATLMKFLSR
jgi:dephospho-CoA kinase